MGMEGGFGPQEKTPRQFPSQEEIKSLFDAILQGKPYKELIIETNEGDVSKYEIEVQLEGGKKAEYNYQKARNNYEDPSQPPGARYAASIHVVYYGADGMPEGGDVVANYLDGWTYVS